MANRIMLAGVSLLALTVAGQAPALAQDQQDAEQGEFLGTITLGESKRDVQTDTATPLTVIDKQEIDDRQASTIAELIDSVPGVTLVNGSTPSGSGINIRGLGANGTFGTDQKVAVLVDGASTGAEEIYRIGTQLFTDPLLFRSVEVQRGTIGSFEYGSGIVGGIVRLETIDASDLTGDEPGFKFAQTLGYGTNQQQFSTSSTLAWQPTENFELLANYSYREQDDQEDGEGLVIGNSAYELPSYLLKGRYRFGANSEHAIAASFTNTESADRDVPYDSFQTSGATFGNVDRDITSQAAALTYTFEPADNDLINLEAELSYANQEISQDYVPGSSACDGGPPYPSFLCGFPFFETGFDVVNAELQYETTKLTVKNGSFLETGPIAHELKYGVEWLEKDRLDANSAPGGTDERMAFFFIDDISLYQGLSFIPAIRYESQELNGVLDDESSISIDDDALMGGATLRYEFESGLALFTSYAYTESLPILDDLENPIFREQPELANTFEAGFSYDAVGLMDDADTLGFKLNYYNTVLDDITSYSGADQVDLTGFEIEASYAHPFGTYLDLNANIADGEETQQSGAVIDWDRRPADTVQFTLGQRLSDITDVSVEALKVFDSSLNLGGETPTETEGVTLVNLRATVTPQEGVLAGTQFRFGLENATNEDYRFLLSTRNNPGRNFKITVTRVFF